MTFLSAPATGLADQYSAVACATRSTFPKVNSSAMMARHPSVPNLMLIICVSYTPICPSRANTRVATVEQLLWRGATEKCASGRTEMARSRSFNLGHYGTFTARGDNRTLPSGAVSKAEPLAEPVLTRAGYLRRARM